jgi:hypothetical protein
MPASDEPNIDRRTALHGLVGALGVGLGSGSVTAQSGRGRGAGRGQSSPESRNAPELNADQRFDEHLALGSELRETIEQRLITDIAGDSSPNQSNSDADLVVRSPGRQDGDSYRPFAYCKALGYDSQLGIETGRHAEFVEALVDGEPSVDRHCPLPVDALHVQGSGVLRNTAHGLREIGRHTLTHYRVAPWIAVLL